MNELFDGLARALATRTSRADALRLALGAVVAVVLPGARSTTARAAGSQTCTAQEFSCKCPNRDLFYQLCCPGQEGVDYTCECKAPPEGYAMCKKLPQKVCGPDVTSALDAALGRVRTAFNGWSGAKRFAACTGLVTIPAAAFSWDIRELGPGGRGAFQQRHAACSTCGYTVQVGNTCHYSGSVNYIAYGVMMRLCHDHFTHDQSGFADWYTRNEMLEMIYIHKNQTGTQAANFQAANEWALLGYQTGTTRPTPPPERPNCKPCPSGYTGSGLTVNWLPEVIRP